MDTAMQSGISSKPRYTHVLWFGFSGVDKNAWTVA